MQRIVGIDLARGLAVLGMITAHVGPVLRPGTLDLSPWSLAQVVDGRSAALFVLLSGLSVALLSGGPRTVVGVRRVQARTRLLVRALAVLGIGALTLTLGTPIAVILPTYAVLFSVATIVLGAPPRRLLVAAGAIALAGPLVHLALQPLFASLPGQEYTDLLVGDYYPAVVWAAYALVGLAVGRLDLGSRQVRLRLLGAGTALAAAGYGSAAVLTRLLSPDGTLAGLVTAAPHSSTTPEVLGGTGVALAVIALCLELGDRAPRLLAPLAATGSLALTAYVTHLMAIAAIGSSVVWEPRASTWLAFVGCTLAGCWWWRASFGRGPLERLLHGLAARASDIAPDTLPPERTA
ncbi:MAG TPA: heparan-alpha-glucosaminide N-acetyltransferase domain-containing protein [Cellulomonas sp.]